MKLMFTSGEHTTIPIIDNTLSVSGAGVGVSHATLKAGVCFPGPPPPVPLSLTVKWPSQSRLGHLHDAPWSEIIAVPVRA